MAEQQIKGIKINGTGYTFDINEIGIIKSSDGSNFRLKVDNDGNLYTEKIDEAKEMAKPSYKDSDKPKFYINEVYCGGINNNEHSVGYCSHNFVELANLTGADINLNGLSLQYSTEGSAWKSLTLKGIIKAGSTFLIRGAQCAAMDGAKIKVLDYDMEWYENGELLAFNDEKAKFYLKYGTGATAGSNLYQMVGSELKLDDGYINLAGFNVADNESESKAMKVSDMRNKLFKRYYAMDPVSQATKDMSKRSTSGDWNYVDLTKKDGEVIPCIEDFTPRASKDKKDIFYNKTKLYENKPSIITCSFGIQATDNGSGATRCFNWVSKGVDDEYIWIRKKGSDDWGTANESYKNLSSDEDKTLKYYNRLSVEYTDGSVFTVHKFIKRDLASGVYEYIAGEKDKNENPILEQCTPIHEFTVRSNDEVSEGFNFVQTTDQQGFNWDEYRIWAASANEMERYVSGHTELVPSFMINTGDMTQNGNRMGEWLDYFNGKNEMLNNLEEMATIGNNDLSPSVLYNLGDGSDAAKINLENILFFYTFEMDKDNPPVFAINGVDYLVPSLYSFNYGDVHFICMDSELKAIAESNPGKDCVYNFENSGNFYPHIKEWTENDIKKYTGFTWNIAYCHEMPFTILTAAIVTSASDGTLSEGSKGREGASMNANTPSSMLYWFSELCQKNNIRLVIGGHKHTQATSYPLLENVKYSGDTRTVESYRPIIVVTEEILKNEFSANTLTQVGEYKYPDTWVDNGVVKTEYKAQARLSTFKMESEVEEGVKPVVYAMSQATSYKHTSNKELPSPNIPWLRHYYPANGGKVNPGQLYPFYTIWSISKNKIEGRVRKVVGAFNSSGKFDINIDGKYVLNGNSAVAMDNTTKIASVNGLDEKAKDTDEIIEILK